MNERDEHARELHLKRVFGGELSDEERALLAPFERSSEGARFAAETARLRASLERATGLRARPPEGAELRARFEERLRGEAREFRRRFLPFCLVVVALFGAGGLALTLLARGTPREAGLGDLWLLFGAGALALCATMWVSTGRRLRAADATLLLADTRTPPLRRPFTAWTALALLACPTLLVPRLGWTTAAAVTVLGLITLRLLAQGLHALERRRRLREDARLWSWWYGDARP